MAEDSVTQATRRIRAAIEEADEGGYPLAWYFYVRRTDVEILVQDALRDKTRPRTGEFFEEPGTIYIEEAYKT